jgi:YebC/PmpR family DNA-binding regulatory protein
MSGHSHWATIKHQKGAADAKRGKQFSKFAKYISVAVKNGGKDPVMNPALRLAIDRAREINMPKDTIEKAMLKGAGELPGMSYTELTYEGYGPNGVAIVIDVLTDNSNRTQPELRKIFDTRGGKMGSPNCVKYMFKKVGLILVDTTATTEDALMEAGLDAGADDVINAGEVFEVKCPPQNFHAVKKALEDKKIPIRSSELTMIADNEVKITDPKIAEKIIKIVDELEDHDDVQNVYTNSDISDEVMKQVKLD